MGDSRPDHGSRLTRRQLLVGGGSVFAALAAAGVGAYLIEESTSRSVSPNDFSTVPAANVPLFHSRPDLRIAGIAMERERELLRRRLPLAGGRVLSVGCGWHPGRHLFPAPAFHLVGVDPNGDHVRGVLETGRADEAFVGAAGQL